jgi:hypothetical protein
VTAEAKKKMLEVQKHFHTKALGREAQIMLVPRAAIARMLSTQIAKPIRLRVTSVIMRSGGSAGGWAVVDT